MRTLIIGADPFPPYQYIDTEGSIHGSDYERVKSIIHKMGYTAKYIIDDWSLIEKMFINKEIDIVFQVQKTSERERDFFFSDKLRDAITSIVAASNNHDYYTINDLLRDNSKVGVIQNYQYGDLIDTISKEHKKYFKSLVELLDSLKTAETEFGVVDLGVFNYLNENGNYSNLKVLNNLNFSRSLYVAFNEKLLRDKFNSFMHIN